VPQEVQGAIGQPQDVDVFRVEGTAGQRLTIEVLAARLGSPLDPLLTLYDAEGHILATSDDHGGSADSRLDVTLPGSGACLIGVVDANGQGSPLHFYRLRVLPAGR
jgi:hypothetical protein